LLQVDQNAVPRPCARGNPDISFTIVRPRQKWGLARLDPRTDLSSAKVLYTHRASRGILAR
jgi:hypothetical protein